MRIYLHRVLNEDGKAFELKSYIWLYDSSKYEEHRIPVYDHQPSRGASITLEILDDYHGFFHSTDLEVTTA